VVGSIDPMQSPSILLDNISLGFQGKTLFDGFSAEIPAKQCTCLLGPSGCGKSTLLRLVSGDKRLKCAGRVRFLPEGGQASPISWMAQNDLLLPWLTVLDNVILGAKLRGEICPELIEKAQQLLMEAGLEGKEAEFPGQLSGGMRQRVALLRTLMEDRPVILMDEPFSALDALTRMRLQNLAARLSNGKTVVAVTHDPMEALRLADRIVVLHARPVQIAAVLDLRGTPPRDPAGHEVQQAYPRLLSRLMMEVQS